MDPRGLYTDVSLHCMHALSTTEPPLTNHDRYGDEASAQHWQLYFEIGKAHQDIASLVRYS